MSASGDRLQAALLRERDELARELGKALSDFAEAENIAAAQLEVALLLERQVLEARQEVATLRESRAELLAACEALVTKFGVCLNDAFNPCWKGRPDDVAGQHWGVGDACPVCIARAAIAKGRGA